MAKRPNQPETNRPHRRADRPAARHGDLSPAAPSLLADAVAAAGVFVLAIMAFLPALHADFTNWDDPANILTNEAYRGFTPAHWKWFWTTTQLGVYEPLSWMLKAAIWSAAGFSARAFHAASMALHGINAAMVFVIAKQLIGRAMPDAPTRQTRIAGVAAALLFALHPLRTEVVAWPSGQPYALAAFFALASTICYLRTGPRRVVWLVASFVLYAAAMLSKTAAISLPLVFVILDWFPLGRFTTLRAGPFVLLDKIPFFAAAIAIAAYTAGLKTNSQIPPEQIGLASRLLIAGFAPAFYLFKTVVPVGLSPFYALPLPFTALPARFAIGAVASVAITIIILVRAERSPALAAAWLASLVFIAPVSGIVRHGDQYAADRYTYLAQIGLAIIAAGAGLWLWRRGTRRGLLLGASAIAGVTLVGRSFVQATIWLDSGALWSQALAVDPANWCAKNNLAFWYLNYGDAARAESLSRDALDAAPTYADAAFTHGCALADLNRLSEAEAAFRLTLDIDPMHKAVSNLADVIFKQGRADDAADVLVARVKKGAVDFDMLSNTGVFLCKAGRMAEGVRCLTRAAESQPTNPHAWFNLGLMRLEMRDIPGGTDALRRCLALDPTNAKAAAVLKQVGQ